MFIPGIGEVPEALRSDFVRKEAAGDGLFRAGRDGVVAIYTPLDGKVELVVYEGRTLVYVRSAMGHPAIYPLEEARFEPPAKAVLMDLDGTSVRSEHFWVWVIERTTARLLGDSGFELQREDGPHVSGHSVSEHLRYCMAKYCPERTDCELEQEARGHYFDIVHAEMREILAGRGKADAFQPSPGLKEFLLELKGAGVRIGLVTSGLHEKAWPEIVAAFRQLGLGDPLDFYDAIITAGCAIRKGQAGTLGELEPKPHPWLYAEAARVGLGIDRPRRHGVLGFEDSGAGVVSVRLAGFAVAGVEGGNIAGSGTRPFLNASFSSLQEALPLVLGR